MYLLTEEKRLESIETIKTCFGRGLTTKSQRENEFKQRCFEKEQLESIERLIHSLHGKLEGPIHIRNYVKEAFKSVPGKFNVSVAIMYNNEICAKAQLLRVDLKDFVVSVAYDDESFDRLHSLCADSTVASTPSEKLLEKLSMGLTGTQCILNEEEAKLLLSLENKLL